MRQRTVTTRPTLERALCARCARVPPLWNESTCLSCRRRQHRWAHWLWLGRVSARWMLVCAIESVLGMAVGAVLMLALAAVAHGWSAETTVAHLVVLPLVLALNVVAQITLLRPIVARYRLWAGIGAGEVLLSWLAVLLLATLLGALPGLTSMVGVGVGVVAALAQAALLRRQVAQPLLWLVGSGLAWLIAGGLGFLMETSPTLYADDPPARILAAIATGRLIYGALTSPLLAGLLSRPKRAGPG